MGLDFTNIPDREGAALYFLHTGNSVELANFTRLAAAVQAATPHQVVLVDANDSDGVQICDFYDITPEQLPVALIVADDDTIAFQWQGESIPTSAEDIAYQLRQISE